MTFPVVESRSKTSYPGPTASSSHVVTMPSGIVAGDLLLCLALTDDLTITGMSESSGYWAELFDVSYANLHRLAAFWKLASGSDSLTITFSGGSERIAYICWRISGARAVYASSATATGTSDYPDPPNCAPGIGTKDFLWIASAGYLSAGTTAYSAFPSGYSNTNDMATSTRSGTIVHLLGTCEKTANGSSENPGTFSGHVGAPSENWIAKTLAIEPSSGVNPIFFGAGL